MSLFLFDIMRIRSSRKDVQYQTLRYKLFTMHVYVTYERHEPIAVDFNGKATRKTERRLSCVPRKTVYYDR